MYVRSERCCSEIIDGIIIFGERLKLHKGSSIPFHTDSNIHCLFIDGRAGFFCMGTVGSCSSDGFYLHDRIRREGYMGFFVV